jgi:hypothetical protein
VRLYYADPDSNTVKELVRDSTDNTWKDGVLSTRKWSVIPDTPISAHVNFPSAQIKVYYYPADRPRTGKPALAWATVGKDDWNVKDLV